ncbi:protein kinase domain-containing protein [Actinocorallia herbida]|uniref:protein kinase domain-containing protein n=1 Tax=Actinocorallia herbida TaxID=58109 RepID=UPI002482FAF4|nr:protein kinase [Actinocorallia herbida]
MGRLGEGGMGVVFLGRRVGSAGGWDAVKQIAGERSGDPQYRRRFAREVQAARRVRGRYTAEVLDADPGARRPWMATQFVQGPSLRDAVLHHGPLSPWNVRRLGADLVRGLSAVHAARLVHRDLKPGNILLAADRAVIIDFGVARFTDASTLTADGRQPGTPAYMSPEQVKGHTRDITHASDVFSLGSVLTFAATGGTPFEREAREAVQYAIVNEPPRLDGLTGELHGIVAACLAPVPADRPALGELLALLDAADIPKGWPPPVQEMITALDPTRTAPAETVQESPAVGEGLDELRRLLAEGRHTEADGRTTEVLLEAAGRGTQGWLREEGAKDVPAELLNELDALWAAAAPAWGFRAQLARLAAEGLGGSRDFRKIALALGWRRDGDDPYPPYPAFARRADDSGPFYPTLRSPRREEAQSQDQGWFRVWTTNVLAVHARLRRWERSL